MFETQQIPKTMHAAAIDAVGNPEEVVHTEEVPVPRLGLREVLIQVEVAGVGVWDPELVRGETEDVPRNGFPRVFGSDGSGTVVACGKRVTRVALGDRVYGWGLGNRKGGFFAEYVALSEDDVARIPTGLTVAEAGALAVCGITALEGLELLKLRPGDSLIIIGASGGNGHLAVQLAKRLGLRVFALASGRDGVELVRRLGADDAVDGKTSDSAIIARGFAPEGFDGALVFAGRDDGWQELLSQVRKGGRIAWPHGVEPEPGPQPGVKVKGYDGIKTPKAFQRLNALISEGPFHVELSRVFLLDEAAQALREVSRHHVGKLALQVHH